MRRETESPAAVAGRRRAQETVSVGNLDDPDNTPSHRIFQPASRNLVLPPDIPAGSIVARHFFGAVDSGSSMGEAA